MLTWSQSFWNLWRYFVSLRHFKTSFFASFFFWVLFVFVLMGNANVTIASKQKNRNENWVDQVKSLLNNFDGIISFSVMFWFYFNNLFSLFPLAIYLHLQYKANKNFLYLYIYISPKTFSSFLPSSIKLSSVISNTESPYKLNRLSICLYMRNKKKTKQFFCT